MENEKFQSPVCCGVLDKSDMARRRKSDEMKWQIVRVVETGQSFAAVAARCGITKGDVSHLVAKYRQTGNIKDLPRGGRPKVTTEREDRLIMQHCTRRRSKPARQIRNDLLVVIGKVSRQTINNRLLLATLPPLSNIARLDCNMPGAVFTGTSDV